MPKRNRWPSDTLLAKLADQGASYKQIAHVVRTRKGWEPNPSSVMRHLQAIGAHQPRHRPSDLVPPYVLPEHRNHPWLKMLRAAGNERKGRRLKPSDERALDLLNHLLYGRGEPLVIGYLPHPDVGFYLTRRKQEDTDIVRFPSADVAEDDDPAEDDDLDPGTRCG